MFLVVIPEFSLWRTSGVSRDNCLKNFFHDRDLSRDQIRHIQQYPHSKKNQIHKLTLTNSNYKHIQQQFEKVQRTILMYCYHTDCSLLQSWVGERKKESKFFVRIGPFALEKKKNKKKSENLGSN